MIAIIVFLVGLALGSFFNVCIYRIPNEKSIVFPPSHCTSCDNKLKTRDLIPVFSYIFLKGKCRYCNTKISKKYPIIELLTAVMYLITYLLFGLTWHFLINIILISLLIIVSFIDLEHMIIPDELVIVGMIAAVIFQVTAISSINYLDALIGLLAGGGVFLIIALLSMVVLKKEGMGGGDIKLMAMIGAIIGWKLTVLTIFLSAYVAGVLSLVLLIFKVKKRGEYIPYGPFIAIATIISIYWGMDLLNWWLGLF